MMKKYNINQTTLKILSLYRNNYNTSLHLREISRQTNVDVKATQLQLKKLEKINIILGTTKGRNKEYNLNLNNYTTKYYMTLAETYTTINYLNKNYEIKKLLTETEDQLGNIAILFGSFAKQETTPESDIDILIITNTKPDTNTIKENAKLINREINIKSTTEEQFQQGLTNNDPLISEIIANHILLKGIDNICNIMWRHHARR
jgi:predicted nucleotidyltransferase